MKAHVYVTLKTSVLDPQGQTIHNALRKIGYTDVAAVRQGKYFALTLAASLGWLIRRRRRCCERQGLLIGAGIRV